MTLRARLYCPSCHLGWLVFATVAAPSEILQIDPRVSCAQCRTPLRVEPEERPQ